MKITFYGVRGSMPVSGADTLEFGGRTSCVLVQSEKGSQVILDCGTGIVPLGKTLTHSREPITVMITHNHWDHIQGFPYFLPIYQTGRKLTLIVGDVDDDDKDAVLKQMSGSTHPVKYDQLPADISLDTQSATLPSFDVDSLHVKTQALNHPDGGTAYCIYGDNQKIAYVTDNELVPAAEPKTSWAEWVEFIEKADVLIHDAQYVDDDMPLKHGWGHSTATQVAELAIEAKVKQLFIISHDPERLDRDLQDIERQLQEKYTDKIDVQYARESFTLDLNHTKN